MTTKQSALSMQKDRKTESKNARMNGTARRGGALLGKGEPRLNRPEYLKKDFKRRWFIDQGGRLNAAYNNDWDYVLKDNEKMTMKCGTNIDGTIRIKYLMEKDIDWYKEDQFKKRTQDRKNEELLRSGQLSHNSAGQQAAQAASGMPMYLPGDGIQINSTNSLIKQ